MSHLIRNFICLACLCNVLTLEAEEFSQPKPVKPLVAESSDEAAQAMSGVRIPKAWGIELFAAEPEVANIVAFDIDARGRIYVCESFRQSKGVTDNRAHDEAWVLADLASQTVQDRIDYHKRLLGESAITYAQQDDRIRRIEDTDGDGIVDRSTVVVNGFNKLEEGTGAGVLVRGQEIFYTNIPKLWKLVDKDDDGVADERTSLHDGFGVRVAFRGHDLHGILMGVDGRIYFSIGDRGYNLTTGDGRLLANPESGAVFRCELDGSGLEVVATGLRNPQELAFNDLGDLFTVDNNSDSGDQARIVQILEQGDSGWRMQYQYLSDRGPFNREKIWEPFHDEQPAFMVPPIANFTDGPSGLAHYPGTGFGDQLKDTFLICDFRGGPSNSGVRSFKLATKGAFYELAEDSDPLWNVLATDVAFGPDGAIYVSDWVNGWEGLGKGRIYRITDSEAIKKPIVEEVRSWLASDWSTHEVSQLAELLGHADRRVRLEAQWELANRGKSEIFIEAFEDTSQSTLHRLHALWGADQLARTANQPLENVESTSKKTSDKQTPAQKTANSKNSDSELLLAKVRDLLKTEGLDPILQSAVAKLLGDQGNGQSNAELLSLLKSKSSRVRYHAAMAIGKQKTEGAFDPLVAMAAENDNQDPAIRHAVALSLSKAATPEQLVTLKDHKNVSVRRVAVVALRRIKSGAITEFLADANSLVATEAARAIHDLPIHEALPALAKMAEAPLENPPFSRRVVNANFRIGSEESAQSLAEIASRNDVPEQTRIDAISALKDWMDTDPRDRVLNTYRPLGAHVLQDAMAALEPKLDSLTAATTEIREASIAAASTLGIKKIIPFLEERASDIDYDTSERASVLIGLSKLDPAKAVAIAKKTPLRPCNDFVLAAVKVLAKHDRVDSLPLFLSATDSRHVELQALGWDILRTSNAEAASEQITQGIEQYIDGTLNPALQLNVLEAAEGKLTKNLQTKLTDYLKKLHDSEAIGKWLVSQAGGDVERGRKLFFEKTELSCVRCHRVDRVGGQVGPDLTIIGKKKDTRYLLEAIVIPDASIAEGFATSVIVNDSGEVYTGILQSENDDQVELMQSDGTLVKLYQDEIVARKTGNSSMPSDLVKYMTPRELRDLVAYLASLQVDPRAKDDVE